MTEQEKFEIFAAAMAGKPLPDELRATFILNPDRTFSPAVVSWPSMTPDQRCQSQYRKFESCRAAIADAEEQLRGIVRRAAR